jgi:hypothetical protein
MYPSQLMWWGTTDLIYFPPVDLDTPRYFTYHRQADYWYWWSYGPNWEYMYGTMTYSHGNFTQGSTEYYMIVPTNSGPGWTANEHIGWYMISPSPTQVLAGGSPPSGPTSGGNSTITVPSWGTDNTGPGYGGSSNSVSNTAPVSPGMNVTVNIGSSSGDYQYSNPGYAVIAYGR